MPIFRQLSSSSGDNFSYDELVKLLTIQLYQQMWVYQEINLNDNELVIRGELVLKD